MAVTNQHGWYYDLERCIGCKACSVACKAENNTDVNTDWRWVMTVEGGTYPTPMRYFVSLACMHCEEPACLKACPLSTLDSPGATTTGNANNNAIVKRGINGDMNKDDGIVYIDDAVCNGCKRCISACPYGAPQFNEDTQRVQKCHLCMHRIDAGLKPACQNTCVGKALFADKLSKIDTDHASAPKEIRGFADPELTLPSIRFKKVAGAD
jgi:anaerobic dimethyl sulfoxide reductase subunit B (iron-sulfur subunit)